MKKYLLLVVCCFIFFSVPAVAQQNLPTIAILDVSGENVSSTQTNLIYEYIIDRMNRSKTYTLVERSALNRALEELEMSMSDIVDESTAVQIGKVAGARYVLITSIIKIDTEYHLSMRVVNVETSKIQNTAIEKTNSFSNIDTLTQSTVARLFDMSINEISATPEPEKIVEQPKETPVPDSSNNNPVVTSSPKASTESQLVMLAGGGATVPILDISRVFAIGFNGLIGFDYSMMPMGPGDFALGIQSGAVVEPTHPMGEPNSEVLNEFTLVAVPAFVKAKYHLPLGDFFMGFEAGGGVLLSIAIINIPEDAPPEVVENTENPMAVIPAASGGIYGGMMIREGFNLSIYANYLHGFFTSYPYTGIKAGVRVELGM